MTLGEDLNNMNCDTQFWIKEIPESGGRGFVLTVNGISQKIWLPHENVTRLTMSPDGLTYLDENGKEWKYSWRMLGVSLGDLIDVEDDARGECAILVKNRDKCTDCDGKKADGKWKAWRAEKHTAPEGDGLLTFSKDGCPKQLSTPVLTGKSGVVVFEPQRGTFYKTLEGGMLPADSEGNIKALSTDSDGRLIVGKINMTRGGGTEGAVQNIVATIENGATGEQKVNTEQRDIINNTGRNAYPIVTGDIRVSSLGNADSTVALKYIGGLRLRLDEGNGNFTDIDSTDFSLSKVLNTRTGHYDDAVFRFVLVGKITPANSKYILQTYANGNGNEVKREVHQDDNNKIASTKFIIENIRYKFIA